MAVVQPASYNRPSPAMLAKQSDKDKFGEGWERDPNRMNTHLQVMWDDLIGEPEGVSSLDCTWNCSRSCFQCTLSCCYTLMTLFYAPLFALCAGCNFACLTFTHIWAYGPCLRTCKINCAFYRKLVQIVVTATVAPCCEAIGLVFSKAKVRRYQYEAAADDEDPNNIFTA